MNPDPVTPPLRVGSPAAILAVVPHLLGFTPASSLVILGADRGSGRVQIVLRFDLPNPPDPALSAAVATHSTDVLSREHLGAAVVVGYGPGHLVTPLMDAIRDVSRREGLALKDLLRVDEGRYWSYLCHDPSCCPAEGVAFDAASHPASKSLAATGQPVLAGRNALAATIAPVTGSRAVAMHAASRHAERAAARLTSRAGSGAVERAGVAAVRAAIHAYRDGGSITPGIRYAWLALVLTRLRVRDEAWAWMDPAFHAPHRRLWTDLVRHAQPGYVAGPACLLAITAWQNGDGALANLALDRAVADDSGYSMAELLRQALRACVPPSGAAPPMTPEQVAEAYSSPDAVSGAQDTETNSAG